MSIFMIVESFQSNLSYHCMFIKFLNVGWHINESFNKITFSKYWTITIMLFLMVWRWIAQVIATFKTWIYSSLMNIVYTFFNSISLNFIDSKNISIWCTVNMKAECICFGRQHLVAVFSSPLLERLQTY